RSHDPARPDVSAPDGGFDRRGGRTGDGPISRERRQGEDRRGADVLARGPRQRNHVDAAQEYRSRRRVDRGVDVGGDAEAAAREARDPAGGGGPRLPRRGRSPLADRAGVSPLAAVKPEPQAVGRERVLLRSVKTSGPRRPKRSPVFAIILVSVAAGYALAITVAKAGAPKQTVYELPHDFTLNAPTFLPSALPGAAMTSGNRLELLENGDAIFPAMLAAISSARKTVNFESYIFWSGEVGTRFRDALAERAGPGVPAPA